MPRRTAEYHEAAVAADAGLGRLGEGSTPPGYLSDHPAGGTNIMYARDPAHDCHWATTRRPGAELDEPGRRSRRGLPPGHRAVGHAHCRRDAREPQHARSKAGRGTRKAHRSHTVTRGAAATTED